MRRFAAIVALHLLLAAVLAGGADARRVTVLIVTGPQPADVRAGGAVGLYVAGRGLYVSREEALERLDVDPYVGRTCGALRRCPIEVFVSVPPLGSQRNTRRFDVTIRGAGWSGLLVSDRTRLPGLLAIEDVGETVRALERGAEPPIRTRRTANPIAKLNKLDERMDDARHAQGPATLMLALVLLALASLALVTGEAVLARGALVFPLAAMLLATGLAAIDGTGSITTTLSVLAAAPVALGIGRLRGDAFAFTVAGAIGLYGLALAGAPEANSLSGLGPHPWNGGRFYGMTNQAETLVLPPALAAGAIVGGWRLGAIAALSVLVAGTSKTGADGGGLIVYAAAFVVLWLRLRGRRPSALAAVVVVGVAVLVIGLDAATGGSSHVIDTVGDGPDAWWDAFDRRMRLSWSIVTSTIFQAGIFVASLGVLAWLATLRPRAPVVDAFLVALAVSLLVNDSPTKVIGFGVVACGALRAWSVSTAAEAGIESRT